MKEVYLVVGMLGVFLLMLVPVGPWVIDAGIYLSFLLAAFVLTVALVVDRPAEFLTFPVILIVSVVFRLGLNVASTRLIIQNGATDPSAAGTIISSIANLVIGSDLIMGLLIFMILLIVNLVVINKGASRMAEVGARFTLDGVPGRQMAIDADLASGSITHEQAQDQRRKLQSETAFFGSLDGAAKFIKGDAIAGIFITLLNLVMGTAIASISKGIPVGEAFSGFATLTIGDGIVSQIPAVMISIAGAMLLSRSGARNSLSQDFVAPLKSRKGILYTLLGLVLIGTFLPGVPLWIGLLSGTGFLYLILRKSNDSIEQNLIDDDDFDGPTQEDHVSQDPEITLCLASNLMYLAVDPAAFLPARIEGIKAYISNRYGIDLNEIICQDQPTLEPQHYSIKFHGIQVAVGSVHDNTFLMLSDQSDQQNAQDKEPVFGLSGHWCDEIEQEQYEGHALRADEIIATHLLNAIEENLEDFASFARISRLWAMYKLDLDNESMIDELQQKIKFEDLLDLCRYLLQERISVRNFSRIVELLFRHKKDGRSEVDVFEFVRRELSLQLIEVARGREAQSIEVMSLSFSAGDHVLSQTSGLLPPETLSKLVYKFQPIQKAGMKRPSILLVDRGIRRQIFEILRSMRIHMNVLAYDEVPISQKISVVDRIEV